jgi:hypothetical protein
MGNKRRAKLSYRYYLFSYIPMTIKIPNFIDRHRRRGENLHRGSKSSISTAVTTTSSSETTSKRTLSVSSQKIAKRQKTYNIVSSVGSAPLDAYSIIQNQSLLSLLSKTKCETCDKQWNGKLHMNKREGLFVILSFECDYCNNKICLSEY